MSTRTNGCFGYGKDNHKVRDCPTIAARGIEAKKAHSKGVVPIPSNHGRFYHLQDKSNMHEGISKL